ncbi:MAG: LPS export ABC transporter permease LptG [Rhodospirillales bacterium]
MSLQSPALAMQQRRLSVGFGRYLARQFTGWFLLVFGILLVIITVGNAADLMDRFGNRADLSFALVAEMALLRVPKIVIDVLGFAMLAAAIGTFWRLTRTQELTVARAAGLSVWQILLPPVLVAILIGVMAFSFFSPLSAALYKRHAYLENEYLRDNSSVISVGANGLWLRQLEPTGVYVLHADNASGQSAFLREVQVLRFTRDDDRFLGRLDAGTAQLMNGFWLLRDVTETQPGKPPRTLDMIELPTEMTLSSLTESFAPWETISFWEMQSYARSLADAGFPNERIHMQFYRLLALPLLYASLVVLAAAFTLRPPRRGGTALVLAAATVTGFLLHLFSSFLFALGLGGKLPMLLATWTPASLCLLVGVAVLLVREDG